MTAKIGLGITVAYESATPGTYTAIGEIYEFTAPTMTMDTVDVTNHSHTDGIRRFIGALIDGGEATFVSAYDPALTIYAALKAIMLTRAPKNWKFTYPGGANTILSALLTSLGRETPLDDKMSCPVSLKVSGDATEAAS